MKYLQKIITMLEKFRKDPVEKTDTTKEKVKVFVIKTEKGFVLATRDENGKVVPCEDKKIVLEKDGIKIVDIK